MSNTRDRIRQAAIARFAEQGFAGTGIRQLADDVDLTTASLYHHVRCKRDLLEDIIESSMNSLIEAAQLLVGSHDDPPSQLGCLVTLHVNIHATYGPECIVVDRQLDAMGPEARRRAVTLRDNYEEIWRSAVTAGCSSGQFHVADTSVSALYLLGSCTAVADWYRSAGRLDIAKVASSYVELSLSAVNSKDRSPAFDARHGLAAFERRHEPQDPTT